jgi:Flp pilus assembly protein TadD
MTASDAPPPARSSQRTAFERLLASGKDGALLRYSLGNELLKDGETAAAVEHFTRATVLDPRYTAAWKLLGKALAATGREGDALAAWRRGIEVARIRGDKQAEKEMAVFAKRIEKKPQGDAKRG